jgi:transposase
MRYIGVDPHTTNFVVCFLDDQERVALQTFALTAKGLAAFKRRVTTEDRLAVEASPSVTFFYTQVRPAVQEIVVVNPYQFAVIGRSKKKTDRHDASMLARFLKLNWLPTVPIPTEPIRQLRTLLEARDGLVELRTKVKNMGHGVLLRHGLAKGRAAFASPRSRQQLLTLPGLPTVEQLILQSVVRQIDALDQEIVTLEATILARGKTLPGLERLLQLRGMNLLMAISLLAEIGDIEWFTNAKQLVSYAGLAPSVRQSSDTERHGKITKRGRKRLRALAIRAVLALSQGPSTPLAEFYALKKRQKGAGKALCATALLSLLFLLQGEESGFS